MLLPSAQHAPRLQQRQQQQQRTHQHRVTVAAAPAAAAPQITARQKDKQRVPQARNQQQQQRPWVSNEQLWRLSIQHKHAQQRRRQHLQLQQDPDSLDLQSNGTQLHQPDAGVRRQPQQQQQDMLHQQDTAPTDPARAAARALTKALGSAGDVGQLLILLLSSQQQLDAIHVSAAVNQCARGLILDLELPPQQQQQLYGPAAPAQLQWLVSLTADTVQQQAHVWLRQQQQQDADGHGLSPDWLLLLTLCQLVQAHAAQMSSQQLCTCLGGVTQLLQQQTQLPLLLAPPFRAACQQLLLAAHAQLQQQERAPRKQLPAGRQLDARGLSLVLHAAAGIACSQGGLSPSAAFMLSWFRASRPLLQSFNPLDLAMSAGALGRMQMFPPAEWMADFYAASLAALPRFPVHELLLLLLGVAGTRRQPPQGWLPAAFQRLQPSLADMSPAQLSTAMMAAAKLNHTPSVAWMRGFWAAWAAQQSGFSARGHATIMWGAGKVRPVNAVGHQWVGKLQAALQQAVAQAATAVAAVALQKIRLAAKREQLLQREQLEQQQQQGAEQPPAHMQHQELEQQPELPAVDQQQQQHTGDVTQSNVQQHGDRQQAVAEQQQHNDLNQQQQQQGVEEQPQLLASASLLHPTDCVMSLAGVAHYGPGCLDPSFAAFWLAQSRSQLVNMNSQELATCCWALGRLRLQPPEPWLQQCLHCVARSASSMSHQQLAMVWWGCARLRYLPQVAVTAELLMCVAEQLPRCSTHSLALVMWSLGALRMRPNKEWMQLVLRHISNNLQNADGMDFCGVLVGLYALGYHPGPAWLDTFTGTLATKVQLVTAQQHQNIMTILQAYGYTAEDKGFAWVMDPATVAAMCDRPAPPSRLASSSSSGRTHVA